MRNNQEAKVTGHGDYGEGVTGHLQVSRVSGWKNAGTICSAESGRNMLSSVLDTWFEGPVKGRDVDLKLESI